MYEVEETFSRIYFTLCFEGLDVSLNHGSRAGVIAESINLSIYHLNLFVLCKVAVVI